MLASICFSQTDSSTGLLRGFNQYPMSLAPHSAIPSPSLCVLGVSQLAESVAFWTYLGFVAQEPLEISGTQAHALFGLEATTSQLLTMPDAQAGHLLLIETKHPNPTTSPYNLGPHAIDIYTTDMDSSLALADGAGANTAYGRLDYAFGPVRLVEGKVSGPDGVVLVFVDITRRRPSLLDRFPERLHSEIHSVVNIVESVDAANMVWSGAVGTGVSGGVGLTVGADATIDAPELGAFLGLATPDRCRMSLLADADIGPIRWEMLQFLDRAPVPAIRLSTWPLPAGLPLVAFAVANISEFVSTLSDKGHNAGALVTLSDRLACSMVDPGGQRYLLIEQQSQ
jgi:catechol 2,3-dioxygenase-like lactoylglutathione lyase family enzyme